MFKSNVFSVSGWDHPSLREKKKKASYLSLIASELFKDTNLLPMCFYLCLFFVFISIAACLHWCGIAEEIKVDTVSSFFYPPIYPLFPLRLTLSLLFFIYLCFSLKLLPHCLIMCVDGLCKRSCDACVCLCLAVVSLSLSLSSSLCCLSKSLPQRMRSFLRTTPLRRPSHISGAPGEETARS